MQDPEGQTFILKDGRALGYRVLGDPDGTPLFFFHGTPGSRYCISVDDSIAQTEGLKIILPERPGYGLSDPKPDRTINDWATDVAELAESLHLSRFHVSGSSGGGPYALACGVTLADHVQSVLLFNTAAPWDAPTAREGMALGNRIGIWTARFAPWLLRILIRHSAKSMRQDPNVTIQSLMKQLPDADRQLLEQPEYRAAVMRDIQEAVQSGAEGHVSDAILTMKPWKIQLGLLTTNVHLWHGKQDTLSPIQGVKRLADQIPYCHSTILPDAGHLLIDHPVVVNGVRDVVINNG